MSQSSPDFSRISPKLREVLNLRVAGLTNRQIGNKIGFRYTTVHARLRHAAKLMGVECVDDAIIAWKRNPNRENEVLWDVVDTLRKETHGYPVSR